MSDSKILHIIPESASTSGEHYSGSTKDIKGRTEYFKSRNLKYEELVVSSRSDVWLLETLKSLDLSEYSSVIIEFPLYPTSLRYLKKNYPRLKVFVRSHNAGFVHRLHYGLIKMNQKFYREGAKEIFSSFERLKLDRICAESADGVLSINEWEVTKYWNRFLRASNAETVPYFLPEEYQPKAFLGGVRKKQCISIASGLSTVQPLVEDATRNFCRLVRESQKCDWKFFCTGKKPSALLDQANVEFLGVLENPFDVLKTSKAMALLSNYGFGFKTKVLDAAISGCFVLIGDRLFKRLPEEVRKISIPVRLGSTNSFLSALEKALKPFPEIDVNSMRREKAFDALDRLGLV